MPVRFAVFAVLTLLLVTAGGYAVRQGILVVTPPSGDKSAGATPSRDDRPARGEVAARAGVVALGRIEPQRGTIEVSGQVGDRLELLAVQPGDVVQQGQVVAQLASRKQRQLEFEAADAQLREAVARSVSEQKLADSRVRIAELGVAEAQTAELDLAVQTSKLTLARNNYDVARKDSERLRALRTQRSNLVTDQESDQQSLLVEQAAAEVAAAEALLKKLESTRNLRLEEAQAAAESARASREQAIAAVPTVSLEKQRDLARVRLQDTEIVAPVNGTVLSLQARPGETLRGPLLRLADLTQMVVVAEVYETEIKRVRVGQSARITSPAFEKPFDEQGLRGTVRRIAQTIVTPELRSLDPLAMTDRRVVEVVIDLDDNSTPQASRLCNLQVDVVIMDETSSASQP